MSRNPDTDSITSYHSVASNQDLHNSLKIQIARIEQVAVKPLHRAGSDIAALLCMLKRRKIFQV